MFVLRDFVLKSLKNGITSGVSRFKISERAIAWLDKEVLSVDDVSEISTLLDKREYVQEKAEELEVEC